MCRMDHGYSEAYPVVAPTAAVGYEEGEMEMRTLVLLCLRRVGE